MVTGTAFLLLSILGYCSVARNWGVWRSIYQLWSLNWLWVTPQIYLQFCTCWSLSLNFWCTSGALWDMRMYWPSTLFLNPEFFLKFSLPYAPLRSKPVAHSLTLHTQAFLRLTRKRSRFSGLLEWLLVLWPVALPPTCRQNVRHHGYDRWQRDKWPCYKWQPTRQLTARPVTARQLAPATSDSETAGSATSHSLGLN